ncbi:hypothetical protein KPG66_10800 [Mycetohabitans sp. B2]|uniref:hypothetical protein n=1 Tax=Mycetohabitans sp. B2 TaxID=2841274 RepID=UPI001F3CDF0D|nr:hypothetical protein [Mycetohabitans sp. B2]MCF7696560.1 hypothetical protein [Mycetohabitans sp. B2]
MADTTRPATEADSTAGDTAQDPIHFDTLWSTAQDALTVYAAKRWSARGDADPGVTLLQALTFAVSDVSYRHTLPLADLLTPESVPKKSATCLNHGTVNDSSIFASEFGPETALTCGPVTLNDYRRLLLDLTDTDNESSTFLFRDVQIATVSPEQSYAYVYDTDRYTFQFVGEEKKNKQSYRVPGQYRLWATLNPGVKDDAKKRLQICLKDNRNLCEWEITDIYLLTPTKQEPQVVIELEDDLSADQTAQVVALAIWEANDALLPWPIRQSAAVRLAQGEAAEAVYAGPHLKHGWIADLPPSRGMDDQGKLTKRLVSYSSLIVAMMTVRGIKRVCWDKQNGQASKEALEIADNAQVQLWVDPVSGLLGDSSLGSAIIVRKRGQTITVESGAVNKYLKARLTQVAQAKRDETRRVPYGQYRHPAYYRSAGSWLPPVYGLQQGAEHFEQNFKAKQLLRFLRPFEQQVANSADQLEKLPRLLAFDDRDPKAAVWGAADWPNADQDALTHEQSACALLERATLKEQSEQQSQDNDKELAIIDYLLGYFGECRASRTLLGPKPEEFCHVQQGFLRQVTRLSYERAAISISNISALQRKIAARLGIGEALFDETLQQAGASFPDSLPFYLIEHQELLPVAPNSKLVNMNWKEVNYNADKRDQNDKHLLSLSLGDVNGQLRVGQLIELQAKHNGITLEPITGIVIHKVKTGDDGKSAQIEIDLEQHRRLQRSVRLLKESDYAWQWRISPDWLKRVVYDLRYIDNNVPKDGTATLTVQPSFPICLKTGDRFALRPKARWQSVATAGELREVGSCKDIVVQVTDSDPIQGTVTVQWIGAGNQYVTTKKNGRFEVHPVDLDNISSSEQAWPDVATSALYGWSVPYKEDTFAFTLSVVLNRSWVDQHGNPSELNQWVEQIVRQEAPSHLNIQLHWLGDLQFRRFAYKYQQWQKGGRPVGDQSYGLLNLLGVGDRPTDERAGIGFVQIADRGTKIKIEEDIPKEKISPEEKNKLRQARFEQQVVYVGDSEDNYPHLLKPLS